MNDEEFSELLGIMEKLGLNDGDIGYSYWHNVQKDLKELMEFYKLNTDIPKFEP